MGHSLLTDNRTLSAFNAIAAAPATATIICNVSSWSPAVGGLISSTSSLLDGPQVR